MAKNKKDSETDLEILRNIEANPKLTQRQIAKDLGMSLGKTNYLIQALLKRGLVKVNNFKTSDNKLGYLYLLTPEGIEAKRKLTMVFLQRKSEEFDKLKQEMENTVRKQTNITMLKRQNISQPKMYFVIIFLQPPTIHFYFSFFWGLGFRVYGLRFRVRVSRLWFRV